jgi:hypothetical protein
MARTVSQIYDSLFVEKTTMASLKNELLNEDGSTTLSTSQDLLNRLTTTSKTAIWKLMFYIIAVIMNIQEQLWDLFKTEIEEIKASAFVGTLKWWEDKSEAFQNGDTLTINANTYAVEYSTIDKSKQIIKHCAANEKAGIVFLKVRRKDTDILSVNEYNAFQSYVNQIKFAGTRLTIYNLNADDLKLYYEIFYDPIISISTLQPLVEAAINNYIENIPFNGEFDVNQLNINLKTITGVKAVRFISGEGKNAGDAYIAFDNYYSSVAGYAIIDIAFPLSSTILYTKKF